MNIKYARSRQISIFTLIISALMLIIMPGNMVTAAAQETSLVLTGFVKISPANNATGQPLSLTLRWNPAPANPYGFGKYYKYCYYTVGGTCSFDGGLYTTQYNISGLAQGTTYYWQIQVVYCKNASCSLKEKYEADNGQVWSFRTTGTTPPGSFAKLSPTNNAMNLTSRTLSWASSQGATSYQYCISPNNNDSNCAYLNGWRDVGNVTSYTVPNDANFIWGNTYYWQIRASNSGGTKLADEGVWWTFTTANLVGTATLVSPTGNITVYTPTYRWNDVTGVTWYYLWVNGPSGNVFNQWYKSTDICSAGTCAVPSSITLGAGNFTWWVQTWNSTGYGPCSNPLSFSTPIPPLPAAAVLVSPNGNIGFNYSPTYIWNAASNATWYYLWINGPAGSVYAQWYQSSTICNAGTCSVTPSIVLGSGTYTWWVQTWNPAGYGPRSAEMTFNTATPPGMVTLISPNGVSSNPPSFQWNKDANATWYYLWISNASENLFRQWYQASAICNATTCTVAAPISLTTGSYRWWVQTWNPAGYGPWSSPMDFSLP